jgi:hypothetical protein
MQVTPTFPELSDNMKGKPRTKRKAAPDAEASAPAADLPRVKLPEPTPAPAAKSPVFTVPKMPRVKQPSSAGAPVSSPPRLPRAGPAPAPTPAPVSKNPMEGGRKPRQLIPGGSGLRSRIARNSVY